MVKFLVKLFCGAMSILLFGCFCSSTVRYTATMPDEPPTPLKHATILSLAEKKEPEATPQSPEKNPQEQASTLKEITPVKIVAPCATDSATFFSLVHLYLGRRYCSGGTGASCFDCSGFTSTFYRKLCGITLKRSSKDQFVAADPGHEPAIGDLVFFHSGRMRRINHVGIYLGNNRFIHSATHGGVMINSLNEDWYHRHFAGIRRIRS